LASRGVCLNISQIDVNCKSYNRNQCTECYQGYYLNNNQCKLPNANCSTFNLTDGGCLSCFFGFTLTNKQCVIVSRIANCLSYDTFGNCLQCSRMFYITNNTCFNVNPLCQNYNSFNGDCTSCFPGYALRNKNCIRQTSSVWSSITNITAVCKSRRGSQCV
jgi:proprotein convertase subtilisin/kexin type 5